MRGGFQMQVELQDGSFDYQKLQAATDKLIQYGNQQPAISHFMTSFRSSVPQLYAPIDRIKAESLGVPVGRCDGYIGNLFRLILRQSFYQIWTSFSSVCAGRCRIANDGR